MQGKKFGITALLLACTLLLSAQFTITGTVTSSEDGLGLPGANVMVKGSSLGTITEVDGSFELRVTSKSDIVVFSYIGYQPKELPVGENTRFNVQLDPDAKVLQEVVVLGYTEKSKTEISSAVTSLDADDINKVTVNNVEDMLIGKAAGVHVQSASGQPGQAAQVRIRGVGSAFSPQSPLVVVDGIIGANYNPNDIESVSVLRDAAATGLYGSRAAAGVIVIKTRSGQSGKPQVQARVLRGSKQATTGNFEVMNSDELWQYHKEVFDPQVFNSVRPSSLRKENYDWVGESFSPATVQRYFLSVNAKKDKFDYYISGDYFGDEGTALNSDFDRLTLNTKVSYQLSDRLSLTTRVFGETYWAKYPHYTFTESPFRMIPWDNPYDRDGNPVFNIGNWYSNVPSNIFHSSQYNQYAGRGSSFDGNLWLEFRIFDWLKFTSQNAAGASFSKYGEVESALSVEGAPTSGRISNLYTINNSYGSTNLLRFDKDFGSHAVSGFAGIEGGAFVQEFDIGGAGIGIFPGQEILSAAGTSQASGNRRESRAFSVLSQLNYNFLKKYFLTASFRRDGSSKFGPSNRYANFYTGAVSWLISSEDFMEGLRDKVHYLKLRASYGAVGNETFPNNTFYPYFPSYSFIYQYNNQAAAFPVNLGNPSLSWESSYPANLGIDIGLFKRLEINLDVYSNTTKDLLFQDPTAYSKGFQFQWKNVGEIRNRGLELGLNASIIEKGDWAWDLNFNFATNRNELIKLSDKDVDQIQISTGDIYQVFREGEAPFSWFMPKWLGVDPANGDPQWEKINYDDNGNELSREVTNNYAEATFQTVGTPFPDFTGGFSTNLSWKGLSLQTTLSFVYGNDIYFATRKEIDNDGANNNVNAIRLGEGESRWERPGDNATHPKPQLGGNKNAHEHSSRYIEDGSYLRLRNVTLTYDLPASIISKLRLQQLQLRISADNFFTWTKFSGMDPDVPLYRTSSFDMPGLSNFKYPISKQVLGGIEIRF
jgi:TonB-linked SusC/RagA family outer membrane protein